MKTILQKLWRFLPEIFYLAIFTTMLVDILWRPIAGIRPFDTFDMVSFVIVVVLIGLLAGQFYWKNFRLGMTLSVIFMAGSFFMILALLSEFSEFPAGDPEGIRMLLVGSLIFIPSGILAAVMPWKYRKDGNPFGKQVVA